MLKIVVDTNIWIRALLGGTLSLPVLTAWQQEQFQLIVSEELLAELNDVWQRPRLRKQIESQDAQDLLEQLRRRGAMVEIKTVPPKCRDPKDNPVLSNATKTADGSWRFFYLTAAGARGILPPSHPHRGGYPSTGDYHGHKKEN